MDYIGYFIVVVLIGAGIAKLFYPDLELITRENAETGARVAEGPAFYFICALFVGMFIFIVQRKRNLIDRFTDNDV